MNKSHMAGRSEKQRAAYRFLRECCESGRSFTVGELARTIGWKESSAQTYISKQFSDYLERSDAKYFVKPSFRRVTEDQFLRHVTQRRPVYAKYDRVWYDFVVNYEFLLPLTKEDRLRRALDDLFYADTIAERLREIGLEKLKQVVTCGDCVSDDDYIRYVTDIVSRSFVGYSIMHVDGRFRVKDLVTRKEAGELLTSDEPYLVDETTAVVRFIIKCESSRAQYQDGGQAMRAAWSDNERSLAFTEESMVELRNIKALFFHLFVEAVVRTIDGEEEIWLIEQGSGLRLYVWERKAEV